MVNGVHVWCMCVVYVCGICGGCFCCVYVELWWSWVGGGLQMTVVMVRYAAWTMVHGSLGVEHGACLWSLLCALAWCMNLVCVLVLIFCGLYAAWMYVSSTPSCHAERILCDWMWCNVECQCEGMGWRRSSVLGGKVRCWIKVILSYTSVHKMARGRMKRFATPHIHHAPCHSVYHTQCHVNTWGATSHTHS